MQRERRINVHTMATKIGRPRAWQVYEIQPDVRGMPVIDWYGASLIILKEK